MSLRVLIADDHKLIRQGLRALLDKESNIEVVAEAGTGWETLRMAQDMSPDLVIMDVAMPDLNGIEATRQIIGISPHIKVLALSMYKDRRFIVGMLKAGASGYLLKDGAFEELVHAINIVVAGQTYLSPAAANTIVKEYIRQARDTDFSAFSILTPREREVLQLRDFRCYGTPYWASVELHALGYSTVPYTRLPTSFHYCHDGGGVVSPA